MFVVYRVATCQWMITMSRTRSSLRLLRARLFSTTSNSHTTSRVRLSSVIFIASTGVLVSSYLLWPSKYRGSPTFTQKPMSPSYFIPTTVSDISQAGPDLAVLTLTLPRDAYSADGNASLFEPIWSIFVKDDDIQVERPYTPLYGFDDEGNIKLWVKRYPKGEVGRWLHSKEAGDTIEIRGPLKTIPFHEAKWDEIIMVCYLPRLALSKAHPILRYPEELAFPHFISFCFAVSFSEKTPSMFALGLPFCMRPVVRRSFHLCLFCNLLLTSLSRTQTIFA
jgi:hypothetical protein